MACAIPYYGGRPLEECAEGDDLRTTFHLGAFDEHMWEWRRFKIKCLWFSLESSHHSLPVERYGQIPDHQGKGIGKQLIEAGLEKLKAKVEGTGSMPAF
jgi:GNAT superfamily N-acetyltransferase